MKTGESILTSVDVDFSRFGHVVLLKASLKRFQCGFIFPEDIFDSILACNYEAEVCTGH